MYRWSLKKKKIIFISIFIQRLKIFFLLLLRLLLTCYPCAAAILILFIRSFFLNKNDEVGKYKINENNFLLWLIIITTNDIFSILCYKNFIRFVQLYKVWWLYTNISCLWCIDWQRRMFNFYLYESRLMINTLISIFLSNILQGKFCLFYKVYLSFYSTKSTLLNNLLFLWIWSNAFLSSFLVTSIYL